MRAKTIVPVLIVLLVLAVAGGGAFYYFKLRPAPEPAAPAPVAETPSTAGQPQVGFNAALRNLVTLQGDQDPAVRNAEVGGPVHFLDLIETKDQSWLKVDLRNEREFSVGADARVKVDKFVYDPEAGAGEMTMSVVKGVFRYASGSGKPETVSF